MDAIVLEDLRKRYGDTEAVRGVSLTVAHGEVLCLLGPNGAGKTTTVEILEGYRLPTSGRVEVLGHDPGEGARALRERIGIVLQETGVPEELTVTELLAMTARYYADPRPAADLVALVGLDGKEGARAKELSGGQRRRLDLALALVGRPELLFLDEPTTGFDPAARRRTWDTVRALAAEGTTVLLTTHFMDEAQALADRIAVLAAGRIVALGTPAELGGRDRQATEIRFRLPDGVPPDVLPIPPGAERADEDGPGAVVVRAPDGGLAAIHALTGWALEHDVALAGFSVAQPSLEDTYLALTAADRSEVAA